MKKSQYMAKHHKRAYKTAQRDRSTSVTTALFGHRRCPAEEHTLEYVFPTLVSTRDDSRIEEDRGLGRWLGRRRGWGRDRGFGPSLARIRPRDVWRGGGDYG
jgi:hypothetical protein